MREKEQVAANWAKLVPGQMLVGIVSGVNDGGTYGRSFSITGAMVGVQGGPWKESEEMSIGENGSLSRSHLGDEIGNLVVIGCWKESQTPKGKMRLYKVMLPESVAEVRKLVAPHEISQDVLACWSEQMGTETSDAGGDNGLPF